MIGKISGQKSLFGTALVSFLDPNNSWIKLANKLPWSRIERELSVYFCEDNGRPCLPIRRMVGLLLIKQLEDLSDEAVVEKWREYPYWQYLCGEIEMQHKPPCVANELSAFRKRIGKKGAELIFSISVDMHGRKAQEKRAVVDSTVQVKNITYPTDSKLYISVISRLHKLINKHSIKPLRSYVRELRALRMRLRYFRHPTRAKDARRALKRLRTIAYALLRDVQRKLAALGMLDIYLNDFELYTRVLNQKKGDKGKIYSLKEPHTLCISKGKAHKKYEFGSIATVVRGIKSQIILGAVCSTENKHDSKLLGEAISHANSNLSKNLKEVACDKGYRGAQKVEEARVLIPGSPKYTGGYSRSTLSRIFKKRAGIEATIGHLKSDFRMGRNYLGGIQGDHFNLLMSCCAHNLKLWVREIIFLFLYSKCLFSLKINSAKAQNSFRPSLLAA